MSETTPKSESGYSNPDLIDSLRDTPSVVNIDEPEDSEYDLHIDLNSQIVGPHIESILEKYGATIKDCVSYNTTISILVNYDKRLQDIDVSNILRERGGSKTLSIPPEVLDVSNIEKGDNLNFMAKKDKIVIEKE